MPPRELEIARWFAEEVHPHEPALRSYLQSHFPTLRDIDDLVQETYMRIVHARTAGRVADTRPYLFSTARNAAIDLCRRNRIVAFEPIVETKHPFVVEAEANAAETLSHDQELALLSDAFRALPDRCRQVLTLRKLDGLSHRAIAEKLGISENTVSAQITIGVYRVRQYLLARGVSHSRLIRTQRQHG